MKQKLMKISLQNDTPLISEYCQAFECSEAILKYCMMQVGKSKISIEAYLQMNRDWLMMRFAA